MNPRILVVLALVAAAGCQKPVTHGLAEADSLRPMFDSVFANYNREYNAGHIDPLVDRYTPGAVIMPPNAPRIGRDSLRTLFAAAFKDGRPNGTIDVTMENLTRSGPLAVVRARWAFKPTAGAADTGSSVTVWQLQSNGAWKIIEDIWHSDLPVRAR